MRIVETAHATKTEPRTSQRSYLRVARLAARALCGQTVKRERFYFRPLQLACNDAAASDAALHSKSTRASLAFTGLVRNDAMMVPKFLCVLLPAAPRRVTDVQDV